MSNKTMIAQGKRLASARSAAGFRSARAAAMHFGWPESSYRAHEAGTRTMGVDDARRYAKAFSVLGPAVSARAILFPDELAKGEIVPVMGKVGAGAEIEPEFEQVGEDGLYDIQSAIPLPDGMIGFEVEGDSMLPRYEPGDVIVCDANGIHPDNLPQGVEAVVRTSNGKRFLKKVFRSGANFRLESHNASTIEGVSLEWASEVVTVIRARHKKRIS